MEYQEFLCVVEREINQKLGGGVKASVHIATKNNGMVKKGILLEDPEVNISPAIYMEGFYEQYRNGVKIDTLVEEILYFYKTVKFDESWDVDRVQQYQEVKDRIMFKLINTKQNQQLLEEVPHIVFKDLSIVFYVLVDMASEGTATMLIRNEHLEWWGIEKSQLFMVARENGPRMLPPQLMTIHDVIDELCDKEKDESRNLLKSGNVPADEHMFILSNTSRSFGASCILYPQMFDQIGKLLREDYYILPSSVHELIIVPKSRGLEFEELDNMIKEVNESHVDVEEVLGDHAYLYQYTMKQVL